MSVDVIARGELSSETMIEAPGRGVVPLVSRPAMRHRALGVCEPAGALVGFCAVIATPHARTTHMPAPHTRRCRQWSRSGNEGVPM